MKLIKDTITMAAEGVLRMCGSASSVEQTPPLAAGSASEDTSANTSIEIDSDSDEIIDEEEDDERDNRTSKRKKYGTARTASDSDAEVQIVSRPAKFKSQVRVVDDTKNDLRRKGRNNLYQADRPSPRQRPTPPNKGLRGRAASQGALSPYARQLSASEDALDLTDEVPPRNKSRMQLPNDSQHRDHRHVVHTDVDSANAGRRLRSSPQRARETADGRRGSHEGRVVAESVHQKALDQVSDLYEQVTKLKAWKANKRAEIEALLQERQQEHRERQREQTEALQSARTLFESQQRQIELLRAAAAVSSADSGSVDVPKELGVCIAQIEDIASDLAITLCEQAERYKGRLPDAMGQDRRLPSLYVAPEAIFDLLSNLERSSVSAEAALPVLLHQILLSHVVIGIWNVPSTCIPDPPGKVDVLNADANTAAKDKRIAEMVKTLEAQPRAAHWRAMTVSALWEAHRLEKNCATKDELFKNIAMLHVETLYNTVVHPFVEAFASGVLDYDAVVNPVDRTALHKLADSFQDVLQLKYRAQTQDLHYEHDVRFIAAKNEPIPNNDRVCMRVPAYLRLESDPQSGKYAAQPVIAKKAEYFMRKDIGLPSVRKGTASRTSSKTSGHNGV